MADLEQEIAAAKRRLAELEQRRAASPPPPIVSGPAFGPPPETPAEREGRRHSTWLFLGLVGAALFLIMVVNLANQAEQTTKAVAEAAAGGLVDPADVKPLEDATPPQTWSYSETADAMTDAKTRLACTTSLNQIQLSWPYEARRAELCVRRHPRYGLDVFVRLDGSGQFDCDIYDCRIALRFDDAPQVRTIAAKPDDGSTDVVFLNNEAKVVERLKSAKRLRFAASYFQNGEQVFEFDVSGLEWPPKAAESEPADGAQ